MDSICQHEVMMQTLDNKLGTQEERKKRRRKEKKKGKKEKKWFAH
jgi:hypothetical protein